MKAHCLLLCLFLGINEWAMSRVLAFQLAYRNRRCPPIVPRNAISGSTFPTLISPSLKSVSASKSSLSMSTEAIRTLAPGSHVSETEVKKSRFLGYAKHAENWDEASAYIEEVKAIHPKARHWCYGFQCGVNPVSERCSDDGEPAGTAGLPILGTKVRIDHRRCLGLLP